MESENKNPDWKDPSLAADDASMPYPRICAHRGFNTIAPENSMPAFGAAVAMGADEIEFDLWETADGEIVSLHDAELDRVSTGTGAIWDHSMESLLRFDFGIRTAPQFTGMKILTFREILSKFSRRVVMNVHVKSKDDENPLPEPYLLKMISLIREYGTERHCYFMSGNQAVLRQLRALAPDICRCAGSDGDVHGDLVGRALRCGCSKIQLFSPHFPLNPPEYLPDQIERAHANGIRVNLFYSDDREEAERYLAMGIDTILTNDYNRVSQALRPGRRPG
ncbi:MAG: hypothetical protein II719_03675 [Clostridia bacterium]|nr:hypothetical protein [Clostridia bacterium]